MKDNLKQIVEMLGVSSTSSVEITSNSEGKSTAKIKVYHTDPFEAYNTAIFLDDAAKTYMQTDKVVQFKVEGSVWKVKEAVKELSNVKTTTTS